ncbi:flagellar basal body-associated protein FliL [Rhodobacter veldkampii DSM 11550]|uniref:Flagellar basal body-associated protein FliL n=1 Tax=Phaeovulum veldkampii DSM 11550 TaxID=1185920 RepID=A0A2T4JLK5_9RHOB|nr:flagellar basal body-associated FliL family protein [Phaeovulum veldkampii]MBK5946567.1 flagellar basal body-associated protein FliL [Phaeovulum veldkampii DSM 11550]PTE18743.1 flagellar basal body-associated protein FliL [Phaeovulum veldkampii DSM 11550]TDQ60046.1 hypothetical protein EV658_107145 [Phaeovulum veldkampii DSM 11550]
MGKLIPVLMALIGLGAGVGGGLVLRPDAEAKSHEAPDKPETGAAVKEYVKMNNQFVIPVVESGRVASLVILSLSLEVGIGGTEQVYKMEPKLRDSFLQVLFNHANVGGFRGAFTDTNTLDILRYALQEAGQKVMGETLSDVLIVDIVRQDSP